MNNINKIKGISTNGLEREYDVILTFNNPKNNKDYVVYTDNVYDEKGKLRIYAANYNADLPEPFIGYPASKEEWNDICELLDSVIITSNN